MRTSAFLILISLCQFASAGNLGNIQLSQNYAATIEFCSDIDVIVFGNNPVTGFAADRQAPVFKYYEVFQKGRMAIFRCRETEVPRTTITIMLKNGEIWDGFIEHSAEPEKTRYQFCESTAEDLKKEQSESELNQSMQKIMGLPQDIHDIAVIKRSETYQVVNMANDSARTYIKILLQNRSASDYVIDAVMFKYQEGKKHAFNKKEVVNKNWMPVEGSLMPGGDRVSAKTTGAVVLAIPLYTTESGHLNIKIIEKNGSRSSDFFIQAKDMAKIKIFK